MLIRIPQKIKMKYLFSQMLMRRHQSRTEYPVAYQTRMSEDSEQILYDIMTKKPQRLLWRREHRCFTHANRQILLIIKDRLGSFIRIIRFIKALSFRVCLKLLDYPVSILGIIFSNKCFNTGRIKDGHIRFCRVDRLTDRLGNINKVIENKLEVI